jgi:hypothetical protein
VGHEKAVFVFAYLSLFKYACIQRCVVGELPHHLQGQVQLTHLIWLCKASAMPLDGSLSEHHKVL